MSENEEQDMTDIASLLEAITGESEESEVRSNDAKLRAFAWARVSTEEQDKRGESISEQLREIREYAERRGIEIMEEFREAVSAFGNGDKRVEFNRMIAKAKADPKVNAIIVHDFSRFSRDSVGGRALFRDLRDAGIKVMSVSDPDLDPETVPGLYAEAFTFAKNEAYSREIAFHVRKGCRANIRARDPKTGWCFKNGGLPLWGYKARSVEVGIGKGGRPIYKLIWELDDTPVAGKPLWKWVRYCLVKLAMKGASICCLRDFCNENGIPGRRDKHWNSTSWKDLLQDFNLLKYAGFGLWNVRGPNTRRKPMSEWEIVEGAHPAIISVEELKALVNVRRGIRETYAGPPRGRTRKSNYLLTGGPAVCGRCGKNLVGHKAYYVCGSEPYRAGKGCGPGVYVPQLLLESEVIKDIRGLIGKLADHVRFTRKVNQKLTRLWEKETSHDPNARKRIAEIDRKIDHLRNLLERGLDDVAWANDRLRELRSERAALEKACTLSADPPQVDSGKATACRKDLARLLKHAKPEDRKHYIHKWLDKITLFPESREVEIRYTVPSSIMNNDSPVIHLPGL
jgi:hypothetical protein